MTIPDIVNGAFEALAGVAILNHCRALYRDKEAKGVSLWSTVFFSAWGFWNIFYYPHLQQTASFLGGLCVVTANCSWIGLMVYYRRHPGGKRKI